MNLKRTVEGDPQHGVLTVVRASKSSHAMILAYQPGYAAYASLAGVSRSSFAHSVSYAAAGEIVGGLNIPPAFASSESSKTASGTSRGTRLSTGLVMQQRLLGRACGLGATVASAGEFVPRLNSQWFGTCHQGLVSYVTQLSFD